VIYRFARSADDIADEGDDPPAARLASLERFRDALERLDQPESPLFADIARIVDEHDLPIALFHDLLDAFAQDVVKKRYADFAELLGYCQRSANPVGRLLLELFKRTSETELEQSDAICTSLQLVNFWQDVAIDYAKGRIYLPQDEMAAHGVSEAQIGAQRCDDAWRALMAFQVHRSRELMRHGAPLAPTSRVAAASRSARPCRAGCASSRRSRRRATTCFVSGRCWSGATGRWCSGGRWEDRVRLNVKIGSDASQTKPGSDPHDA